MAISRIPPIQCLLTFEALARLRSVTQTAEELCVTPSAVSHRVKQLEQTLEHLIVQANGDEVVIFTDLLGGSINNSAVSVLMRHRNVFVVAGINLTLLLEFLLCEEATTEAAIIYATSAARESIVFINPLITQPSSDPQGESHD